jgi:hypothetical protein
VRPAFRPEQYTAPPGVADEIKACDPLAGSEDLWRSERRGPFAGLTEHARIERDGRRWLVLFSRAWDGRANPPIDVEP